MWCHWPHLTNFTLSGGYWIMMLIQQRSCVSSTPSLKGKNIEWNTISSSVHIFLWMHMAINAMFTMGNVISALFLSRLYRQKSLEFIKITFWIMRYDLFYNVNHKYRICSMYTLYGIEVCSEKYRNTFNIIYILKRISWWALIWMGVWWISNCTCYKRGTPDIVLTLTTPQASADDRSKM